MISNLKEDEQHKHSNGGGWVANTARVADTVFVGPHALVYGQAEITDTVCVVDSAQVSGHAHISGDAIVSGNAWGDGNFKASTGRIWKNERAHVEQKRLKPAEDKVT
jgi:carbonic anhydrase/acetyltransferase-like protein (isoleucine patch superfamily)